VRIDEAGASIKTFDPVIDARPGPKPWRQGAVMIQPDRSWKGRIINALGHPIDDAGPLTAGGRAVSTEREPPAPMRRARVTLPVRTGVRVIDLFTPLCAGQRVGIFAGSGIGKSTLLGMLARSRGFTTAVIALVGERGREVREFLEDSLGADRSHTIAIVATGDESPMMRRLAPKTAMSIAEYFRDIGENVLLIIDSVTRFAHAAREVALAAGEPPVARGYTPSVFSELPKLLERAGPGEKDSGSITAIFSVLVDGDDHNEPVADAIRGTLDGHIVLDRAIADQGRFPAINIMGSVSRLANHAWSADERSLVTKLRAMIARFEDTRDLRLMGGYHRGVDPELDKAIEVVPLLFDIMKQNPEDPPSTNAFQEVARALSPPE
jgi:flagellum-specific ATP synthase